MRISRPLMGLMFNVFVMINVMDGVKYPVQQQLLFCIAPVITSTKTKYFTKELTPQNLGTLHLTSKVVNTFQPPRKTRSQYETMKDMKKKQ